MAETAPLHVQLIAKTDFITPPDVEWDTDADGGEALVEFAGRACYQSWSKPNPKTATNAGYLRHIIDVGHFSVLEHASVSFYITGISRSCTHELIRHRHFSYSQLSQRYVPENESQIVVPPGIEDDEELRRILCEAADASRATYSELLDKLEAKFADQPNAVLAPQTGPSGRAGRFTECHRDPHRGHRQLPRVAALHRDAGQRARRYRDSAPGHRMPAVAGRRRAGGVRRFRDRHPGRRHRGGDKSAGHRGLSKLRCRGKWVWYRQVT